MSRCYFQTPYPLYSWYVIPLHYSYTVNKCFIPNSVFLETCRTTLSLSSLSISSESVIVLFVSQFSTCDLLRWSILINYRPHGSYTYPGSKRRLYGHKISFLTCKLFHRWTLFYKVTIGYSIGALVHEFFWFAFSIRWMSLSFPQDSCFAFSTRPYSLLWKTGEILPVFTLHRRSSWHHLNRQAPLPPQRGDIIEGTLRIYDFLLIFLV